MTEDEFWDEINEFESHTDKLKLLGNPCSCPLLEGLEDLVIPKMAFRKPELKEYPIVREVDEKSLKSDNPLF